MSTSIKEGLDYILQAINNLIEPKLKTLRYDKTYRAKIIEKIDDKNYKISLNGTEYQAPYEGDLKIGDIVKVKAPLNNFSDIYIENNEHSKPIEVVDNLNSTDANAALSANQGKLLNGKIVGTVLYSNSEGTLGDFTLNDSVTNYDYVEFQGKRSTHIYSSGRIENVDGNTIALTTSFSDGTWVYVYVKVLSISGKQVNIIRSTLGYFNDTGSHASADDNNFITKVVGYKIL